MSTRTARLTAAGLGLTATVLGIGLGAGPAAAHVSPDKTEVPAGGFTSVALTVGHGCDGSPTTQVTVQVPEGINNVTPEILPGWDIEVTTEALPEPIEGSHGEEITERDSEVTFTAEPGNELPDGFRLSYTLGFQAPDTPGEHLFFKTIQTCAQGETAWIEEHTGEGTEPEHPAPVVLVTEGSGDGHGASTSDDESHDDAGDDADVEAVDTDSASSTGDGDDDSSSNGLAIAGLAVGAVGLVTGGVALARTRKTPSS